MNIDEDLQMIILTLFGYMFFAVVTIFLFAFVKYLRNRKRDNTQDSEINESLDNRSQLSSVLIEKSENEFSRTVLPTQKLTTHRCENWGELAQNADIEEIEKLEQENKSTKNSLKKYNPYEWLNIDFIFDESGLQEAYRDLKLENMKRAKEDKEFSHYNGFWEWLKGMIAIDEKIIK